MFTYGCSSCTRSTFGDGETPSWLSSITSGLTQIAASIQPTPTAYPATLYTAPPPTPYSNILVFGAVGLAAYLLFFSKRRGARR